MDKRIIYVTCDSCKKAQEFHGQYACEHCHKRFSPFSIASQLMSSRDKEFLEQFKEK